MTATDDISTVEDWAAVIKEMCDNSPFNNVIYIFGKEGKTVIECQDEEDHVLIETTDKQIETEPKIDKEKVS